MLPLRKLFLLNKLGKLKSKFFVCNRTLFSEAFALQDVWRKRLETPILRDVKLAEMFFLAEQRFNECGRASAIDIDIYTNAVKDNHHVDDMAHLIHRHRLSSETGKTLDSTHHAFIRAFLSFGNLEELMKVLYDRLNYGIFPDDYCNILLMDTFLKKEDYNNAAKVAALNMLQEEFATPLITYLCLYSCHKYALNRPPLVEEEDEEVTEEKEPSEFDDEEEIVKIRVNYIINSFFDDHFDLTKMNDLAGKTMLLAGKSLKNNLGNNYELIGAALYKKLDTVKRLLTENKNKNIYYKDAVVLTKSILSEFCKKPDKATIDELLSAVEQIEQNNQLIDGNLLQVVENDLTNMVEEKEKNIIDSQIEIYNIWEEKRLSVLRKELEEHEKRERIREVDEKKKYLSEKEEELWFYDNEEKIDLEIASKRVPYPKKFLGKKKKKHEIAVDYIPPEV